MYAGESAFDEFIKSGKRADDHKLIVVAASTATESRAFANKYKFAVARERMPDSVGGFANGMRDLLEVLGIGRVGLSDLLQDELGVTLTEDQQRSDWGRHVATIPNVILVKWLNEEHARGNVGLRLFGREFDALVARKLRDPEWKELRVDW